jgi:hypothetical protein
VSEGKDDFITTLLPPLMPWLVLLMLLRPLVLLRPLLMLWLIFI